MTGPPVPARLWTCYPDIYFPEVGPISLGSAGGWSGCDLWRIESRFGPLMLRAWPVNGPDPDHLDRIHRWLDQARRLTFLPVPLAGRDGSTWFALDGRAWELAPFLPGAADLAKPPSAVHLGTMFATLASFHQVFADERKPGRSPGLIARSVELKRLISGEFDALWLKISGSAMNPERSIGLEWLEIARQEAPRILGPLHQAADQFFDLQTCIRDVRPDHFLFDGDQLTGLVDFGAMGIDTIATDLARLLGETVGYADRLKAIALEAYSAVRPISENDRTVLDLFRAANAVLGGARWVRWHFVERRVWHDPGAVAAGLARSLARLEAFRARQ